jgi:membrane protein YdbS with pleckstrin-like domain
MKYRIRRIKRLLLNHAEAVGFAYIAVSDILLVVAFMLIIKYNIFHASDYYFGFAAWMVFVVIDIINLGISQKVWKALENAKDKQGGMWQ